MHNAPPGSHTITVPPRALIVQRVLVDGWTSAKVAATFGVLERQVDAWVADYRRHGMTSLRRAASETLPAKILPLTILRPVRKIAFRMARGFRRLVVADAPLSGRPYLRRIAGAYPRRRFYGKV